MLTLLGSKVAVEPLFEPDQIGSIIIPDQAKARANQGIVKYIGPEVTELEVGDHVLFSGYTGTTVRLEGEGALIIMPQEFIQCAIKDDTLPIPGLYFKLKSGEFISATYETVVTLLADAVQNGDFFKNSTLTRHKSQRNETAYENK